MFGSEFIADGQRTCAVGGALRDCRLGERSTACVCVFVTVVSECEMDAL